MEGLLVLIAIAIVVLPIVSVVMISGLSSRISQLENIVRDLQDALSATTNLLRDLVADEEEAPRLSHAREIPPPEKAAAAPAEEPGPEPVTDLSQDVPESGAEQPPTLSPTPAPAQSEEGPREYEHWSPLPAPIPAKPSWLAENFKRASSWLLKEGNIWVSIGVLLFLAGFGLLFSYVSQMRLISLEMRLAGSAAAGIAMAAFGWRMRERRRTYALILQGGGIGVLYIVLLAGAKLGPVLPVPAAVVGMLLLCAFTILLALLQDFEPLALFALLGGFAAPLLVSTGSDNFVALFSIYALLNIEILFIAAQRDWAKTRWGGLLASALVGAVWGALRWRPEYFAQVEPFLILMFVTYSAVTLIPLLPGSKWIKNRSRVDTPMLLSLPFVFLFLQMAAAAHTKYGVALSCLSLGAWYLTAGRFAMKSDRAAEAGLNPRMLLAYCIVFSNLAVPFVFKQAVSSAIWAIEGAVLVAYAAREKKGYGTLACGLFLHIAAFVLYNFAPYLHLPAHLYEIPFVQSGLLDWQNETSPFLLTGVLFAISALTSSYFSAYFKRIDDAGPRSITVPKIGLTIPLPDGTTLAWIFSVYGTIWWVLAVYHVVFVSVEGGKLTAFSILSVGALAGYLASIRLRWNAARFLSVPPIAGALVFSFWGHLIFGNRGFLGLYYLDWIDYDILRDFWDARVLNWLAYAAAFAAAVYTYRMDDRTRLRRITWGIGLFAFLHYTGAVWSSTGFGHLIGALPTVAAIALLTLERFRARTGLAAYTKESHAALSLVMLVRLPAVIASLGSMETGIESFYIPILNPLELWQILYVASVGLLLHALDNPRLERAKRIGLHYVLPFVGFLLVNSIAARAAFRYFGEYVSWALGSHAPHFQGLIAMLWGLTALALIFGGKKYASRFPWFLGAGLLAADIAKLMLIDLRGSATVIRILAFLLLGGLFLLIGWIAPLPPKLEAKEEPADLDLEDEHDDEREDDEND